MVMHAKKVYSCYYQQFGHEEATPASWSSIIVPIIIMGIFVFTTAILG